MSINLTSQTLFGQLIALFDCRRWDITRTRDDKRRDFCRQVRVTLADLNAVVSSFELDFHLLQVCALLVFVWPTDSRILSRPIRAVYVPLVVVVVVLVDRLNSRLELRAEWERQTQCKDKATSAAKEEPRRQRQQRRRRRRRQGGRARHEEPFEPPAGLP